MKDHLKTDNSHVKNKVFIQNIVTPYRSYFFNSIADKDNSYLVYYMSETEADRNWDISQIDIRHRHWIDKWGLYFMLGRFHIHINPVLLVKSAFGKGINELILGGSYCDINIIILALLKHLHLTKKKFNIWTEANYLTVGARNDNVFKRLLRKFIYTTCDGLMFVPGKMSVLTLEKWNIFPKKYVFIPNTIDESGLLYQPFRKTNINEKPLFVIPARLIEYLKGIKNFFDSIGVDNIKRARFVIAGDGADFNIYKKYIENNKLQEHIALKGFCDSKIMSDLYNNSDAFILPSFSDPSPLSLVEALRYHLPIFCSSYCGNHFEAVEEGVNGMTFSPYDKNDTKRKFEVFLQNRDKWEMMGEASGKIYDTRFKTSVVVDTFISSMVENH